MVEREPKQSLLRTIVFWIHLVSAIATGIVIAVMSVTGIGIAFEEEIVAWCDRDVSRVERPAGARVKTIEELLALVAAERDGLAVDHVVISRDPTVAYELRVGWGEPLYVDPYTGATADSQAHTAREVLEVLEVLHRFLGFYGEESWLIGRHINGAANLALLLLAITGIYLWFPRKLTFRRLRKVLMVRRGLRGHARDFNWHHVFGFWSLPGIVVLAATAVVISYEWGHAIPFWLYGEQPPESRSFGMMAVPPATTPTPAEVAALLRYDEIARSVATQFPAWERIGIHVPEAGSEHDVAPPIEVDVIVPDAMPSRAWVPLEVDPYTGAVLQSVSFDDRSPGLRARIWARFLHTGAGFGLPGKIAACLFTAASLVLVYTGFALSYRRFFRRTRSRDARP